MTHHQLAPNPAACQSLTDPDAARLRKQYPDLWANPHKSCIICRGAKTFTSRERGVLVTYQCDCIEQWKLHRWLLNAGIGLRYQRLSWMDAASVNPGAQHAVLDYAEHAEGYMDSGHGLTLGSTQTGTGKTLLATLLLKTLLAEGHDGFFIQFNEMLDAFSAGWRDEEERAWFVRRVRNAGVLVVDDIGREHKGRSEVAEAMFDTVMRARVNASRPTIITTNYTPEQMLQGYGGNVLSLLSEANTYVEVPGVDYRPKVREQLAQDARDGVRRPLVVG